MNYINLLHPKDIVIEVNGEIIATATGYKLFYKRDFNFISSFNNNNIKFQPKSVIYHIQLSKITPIHQDEYIDFSDIENFNLVINQRDYKLIFYDCNWSSIREEAFENKPVIELIDIIALKKFKVNESDLSSEK